MPTKTHIIKLLRTSDNEKILKQPEGKKDFIQRSIDNNC